MAKFIPQTKEQKQANLVALAEKICAERGHTNTWTEHAGDGIFHVYEKRGGVRYILATIYNSGQMEFDC